MLGKFQCSIIGAGRHSLQKKGSVADGRIDPERDIYAIPSQGNGEGKEIYFLSLVDVLTHYGKFRFYFNKPNPLNPYSEVLDSPKPNDILAGLSS